MRTATAPHSQKELLTRAAALKIDVTAVNAFTSEYHRDPVVTLQAEIELQEQIRKDRQRERDRGMDKLELPCANGRWMVGHLREFFQQWQCSSTFASRILLGVGKERAMRSLLQKGFFEWVHFDPHAWRRLLYAVTHEEHWNEAGTIYDLKSGTIFMERPAPSA